MRHLGCVRHRAGKIRDMDVMTVAAISMRIPTSQQEELVVLLHYLGAKRHMHAKRLHSIIRKRGINIIRGVTGLSSRLRKLARSRPNKAEGSAIENTRRLLRELEEPSTLTSEKLHAYRLKVKKIRDIIQLRKHAPSSFIEELGKVSSAIGDWHDWKELLSIAKELSGQKTALTRKVETITANRCKRALSSALRMRRKYFPLRDGKLSFSALRVNSALES